MPISPARQVAYRILRQIESGGVFAADLLAGRKVSELKAVDRNLAHQLVMGVLRWGGELDYQIERLSGKPLKYFDPEVVTILRLGIFQIRFLTRVPKPAIVHEAVEMAKAIRKRSAGGLINAVLRKCERPARLRESIEADTPDLETLEMARRSIPSWLIERWTNLFGEDAAQRLAWRSMMTPPATLRVSRPGTDLERLRRELVEEGIKMSPGRYSKTALVVTSGNRVASKALREAGAVIQDEASQLVAELVLVEPGNAVLDLCAAPGIKTFQIADKLEAGMIVACDLSASRLRTMARLFANGPPPGVSLNFLRVDATRSLPFGFRFSRVLVDVPCSGTGTLARNPEIKTRLRPQDLPRLAETQSQILRNALEVLAPGGRLVYATCSLEPEENEGVVEKVLGEIQGFRLVTPAELSCEFPDLRAMFDGRGYFRTRPDLHSVDGFFAAVIARSE